MMPTVLITEPTSISEIRAMGEELFGDMVKAVVDVHKEAIAVGGELHADEEAFLIARNSRQENLWGINIFTEREDADRIEFDSMINIRPRQNNRSRSVEDPNIREAIVRIVQRLVR